MTGLDGTRFREYAQQQVDAAEAILDGHDERGPVCACGRTTPCAQALAVLRRRAYFLGRLAQLAPTRAVGRAGPASRRTNRG